MFKPGLGGTKAAGSTVRSQFKKPTTKVTAWRKGSEGGHNDEGTYCMGVLISFAPYGLPEVVEAQETIKKAGQESVKSPRASTRIQGRI